MTGPVVVVCGPTASGKTAMGVALARRLGGEVVSADSMQIYRWMDIGTAKPTWDERQGVPHHMVDVADPKENYSVARYVEDASRCVDGILARGKLPLIVGGTGLYIDNLIAGRVFAPFTGRVREQLQQRAAREGLEALYRELEGIDPQRAARLHPGDEKRILRALEIFYETGETMTRHDEKSRSQPPRYKALRIGLTFADRAELWARIDRRVDQMIGQGLAGEVEALLQSGVPMNCTAMQAIGYKELARALAEGGDLSAAAEEVKLRSRQYAKRQLTWFRREPAVHWIEWKKNPDFSAGLQSSTAFLEEYGIS